MKIVKRKSFFSGTFPYVTYDYLSAIGNPH